SPQNWHRAAWRLDTVSGSFSGAPHSVASHVRFGRGFSRLEPGKLQSREVALNLSTQPSAFSRQPGQKQRQNLGKNEWTMPLLNSIGRRSQLRHYSNGE